MSRSEPGHRIRFRLMLATASLALVVSAASVGTLLWWSGQVADEQIDGELRGELTQLLGAGPTLPDGLAREVRERSGDADAFGLVYLFAESHDQVIEGSLPSWPDELGESPDPQTLTVRSVTHVSRRVRLVARTLPDGRRLAVGRDVTEQERSRDALRLAAGLVLALALGVALAGGLAVSRSLLRRVEGMRDTVLRILGGRRTERVPVSTHDDEFDALAAQFNRLLDENEALVERTREVTNEVAHDLRTPLSRMRARIESALSGASVSGDAADTLHSLLEEVDRVLDTFNSLLAIAQVETGRARDAMETLDLGLIARDAVDLYQPVAEEAGLDLVGDIADGAQVTGNRHLLAQAVTNLIDNALKYAGRGRVSVAVRRTDAGVALSVTDAGPGIPSEDHARVLQRFARLDAARSLPGTGLGLALVAAVASLHDADLQLTDAGPGLRVTLSFSADAPRRD